MTEKWGIFELERKGKSDKNPYRDYCIKATFSNENENKTVEGFYDGDGVYKVRFMPDYIGTYHYKISGNFSDKIEDAEGSFEVTEPSKNNHGPVMVVDKIHLAYADGTPYYSIGTTCYAWAVQPLERQEQTLETLKGEAFNKIRFCFFPKFYDYNKKEPLTYPFVKGEGQGLDPELVKTEATDKILFPGMQMVDPDYSFDYTRPNPEHFKRFDLRIAQLQDMGIEADMILMHPYDRWGMNQMSAEACDWYLKYIVARYSAFRNVWWSLANEYDFILSKKAEDWERYGQIVSKNDPYHRLLSIHNGFKAYDFSKDWITHCSLQREEFYKTTEYTGDFIEKYEKPVVWDEVCYEGNINHGWGNITGQELIRRFWEAVLRGGHCGHGETFVDPEDVLWWSHGGILKGESPARLKFMNEVLQDVPGQYLNPGQGSFDEVVGYVGNCERDGYIFNYDFSIRYLGITQPKFRTLMLPTHSEYEVDLIDTWNMTIKNLGRMSGCNTIEMPGNQYMAIRIKRL